MPCRVVPTASRRTVVSSDPFPTATVSRCHATDRRRTHLPLHHLRGERRRPPDVPSRPRLLLRGVRRERAVRLLVRRADRCRTDSRGRPRPGSRPCHRGGPDPRQGPGRRGRLSATGPRLCWPRDRRRGLTQSPAPSRPVAPWRWRHGGGRLAAPDHRGPHAA